MPTPKKLDPAQHAFPTKQLAIIGICRFSEPLAFNSILAYSYVMVKDLGIHEKDAPFYSGLLLSAYAVAEAITAMGWGALSDRYGRKPIVLIGLAGVALSSIMFGFAKAYWVALLARFIGGALNGNVAVMQTMVAEMVKNPDHEPRAYAVQPFVWTLGGIIGSAMGGFLAQPANFYPGAFSKDSIWGQYPYLLPNVVAAGGIILAIIQGMFLLEETNPRGGEEEHEAVFEDGESIMSATVDERTPLFRPAREDLGPRRSIDPHANVLSRSRSRSLSVVVTDTMRSIRKKPSFLEEGMPSLIDQRFDIRHNSFGTMHSIRLPKDRHRLLLPRTNERESAPPARKQKTFNYTIIMITIALVLIAYHQMAFITLMPIYMLDQPFASGIDFYGGLGFSLHDVGTILAVNGFIQLFIQGVIFPIFVGFVGVWGTFVSMIVLYPTCYFIVPFVSAFSDPVALGGVYLSFILQGIFGILAVPCALILLKNATTTPGVLGRVNGLAMSATCLARTVSTPLAGIFYSLGGSAVAWFSLGAVAVLAAIQLFWVPKEHVEEVEIENPLKPSHHDEDVMSVMEVPEEEAFEEE